MLAYLFRASIGVPFFCLVSVRFHRRVTGNGLHNQTASCDVLKDELMVSNDHINYSLCLQNTIGTNMGYGALFCIIIIVFHALFNSSTQFRYFTLHHALVYSVSLVRENTLSRLYTGRPNRES